MRGAKQMIQPVLLVMVFGFLVAPILISACVSFTSDALMTFPPNGFSWRWYRNIIDDATWPDALLDTLVVGSLCTVIATAVGTLSAYGIGRIQHPALRNAVLVTFLAPLAVPYVSFGMAVYPVFASYHLIGTRLGVALAQAVIAVPFVVIAVISTQRRRDRVLENAARTLGARPLAAFRYIVLPLLAPGIIAGAILSFMTSFDDVIMPIFLGGADVATVPKTMLDSLSLSSDPSVMAASTTISAIGLAAYLLATAVRRRRDV
jgi:putative spermidine/putrescine transport system permease protein